MNNLVRKPLVYRIRRKGQVIAVRVLGYKTMTRIFYRVVMKKRLHLKTPLTFNEKIQWLKLYSFPKDEDVIQCADKYAVRDYVAAKGHRECLNGLIGVWDKACDISWDELPERFAIKCNHGCGYNIICNEKSSFDIQTATKQIDEWMHEDFSLFNCEVHYASIPRKIICEEYLETTEGFFPRDYKFFCFNGVPHFVGVFCERSTSLKRIFLDLKWKPISISKDKDDYIPEKPECYEAMLRIVRDLCKDFTFARVDMYALADKPIFGEMTFTPTGGLADFFTAEADKRVGEMLDISKEMKHAR